jgi:hypothetical protein
MLVDLTIECSPEDAFTKFKAAGILGTVVSVTVAGSWEIVGGDVLFARGTAPVRIEKDRILLDGARITPLGDAAVVLILVQINDGRFNWRDGLGSSGRTGG